MARTAQQDLIDWGEKFRNRIYNQQHFYMHGNTISREMCNILSSLGCGIFNIGDHTDAGVFRVSVEQMKQVLSILEMVLDE